MNRRWVMPPPGESTRALVAAVLGDAGAAGAGPWMLIVKGPRAGERLPVRDGAVLGRGRAADVRLGDGLASRRHARFTRVGARWVLHDLGSKNGVRVNGRRAAPDGSPLSSGDRVSLGGSVLLFETPPVARPADAEASRAGGTPPAASPQRRALVAAVLVAAAAVLAAAAV